MNKRLMLTGILALALVLGAWGLPRADIQSDLSINSFRALGWLDYLGAVGQTTPIQWFGTIPWWGVLSFHDHPPLVFLLQHLTYRILGDTTIATFLPFLISGLAALVLVYMIAKKSGSETACLLAAFIATISSYAVWAQRAGHLEAVETVFILASIYFFIEYTRGKTKAAVLWGAATAFAILSKYTSIFLIAAAFAYALFWQRNLLSNKKTLYAFIVFLVLLTPVITYNTMIYVTRGHFDAALSSILGMHPQDFGPIATRGTNLYLRANLNSIWNTIRFNTSFPLLLSHLGALLYSIAQLLRKKSSRFSRIISLNVLAVLAMFSFSGTGDRFLSIIVPLLSINLALVLHRIWQSLHRKALRRVYLCLVVLILGIELFYNVNTNLLIAPFGKPVVHFSPAKLYRYGYNELEVYVRTNALTKLPERKTIRTVAQARKNHSWGSPTIILLDDQIDYFALMWYWFRYQIYYQAPLLRFGGLFNAMAQEGEYTDAFSFLKNRGAQELWLVFITSAAARTEVSQGYKEWMAGLEKFLQTHGEKPFEAKNYAGETTMKVYHYIL